MNAPNGYGYGNGNGNGGNQQYSQAPQYPQQSYQQQQPQYGQYPQQQQQQQAQQHYGSQYPQQPSSQYPQHHQAPPSSHNQQHQQYGQPLQQVAPQWGQVAVPVPSMIPRFGLGNVGVGSLGSLPGAAAFNQIKIKTSGLPAVFAFGMALLAVAVALIFDIVFLKVSIPGVGGYAWYLTTALSFMGAGYGSMMWTRAGKTGSFVAVGIAAALYGIADLGLGLLVESLPLNGAIILAAQGIAIGFFTGYGGVYKAIRARNDD